MELDHCEASAYHLQVLEGFNFLSVKNAIKKVILFVLSLLLLSACGRPLAPNRPDPAKMDVATTEAQATFQLATSTGRIKIKAEVWTDNWFAFYLGETLIKEDSVSITTERSFNKEVFTFEASYPLQLNFIVKDYMKNDTGLEYIGTHRQQMGDGGFIAQFTNAETGELIAVTDANWAGLVIHTAPLDESCAKQANPVAGAAPCVFSKLEEPAGWMLPGFDDLAWAKATIYSEQQIRPKQGFEEISWNPAAKLIWGPDLKKDNIIIFRSLR